MKLVKGLKDGQTLSGLELQNAELEQLRFSIATRTLSSERLKVGRSTNFLQISHRRKLAKIGEHPNGRYDLAQG